MDLSFSFRVNNKSMELLLAFEIIHDFRHCLEVPDTSPIISFYYFDSNLNSQIVGLKFRQAKTKQKGYERKHLSDEENQKLNEIFEELEDEYGEVIDKKTLH